MSILSGGSIKRLNHIVNVLFKHELGYLIDRLGLKVHLPFQKRLQKKKFAKPVSVPSRLRLAMEELSGAFVKLGQLLSLRPDLVPEEYCNEFRKLLDEVKPFPYPEVKRIVEDELKKPINKAFLSFTKEPIASASVGQVHKAYLKNGEKVAVKVQRPDIEKIFKEDIELLYHLAHLLEKYMPELRNYNITSIIKEFEEYTKDELDYTKEGRNIDIFHKNFRNTQIKIPRVYWDYTTKRVLTMEYIDGVKISEAKKINKKKIARTLAQCFFDQVFDYSVFHADPHPGNIFITKNKKIALLDFGIVGILDEDLKNKIEDIFVAMIQKDKESLVKRFIDLGIVQESVDIESLKKDLSKHWGGYYDITLKQIRMGSFFYDTFLLTKKYKMKFPSSFVLLLKAMLTTEGLGRDLDPDFNFVRVCKPTIKKILNKKKSPMYIAKEFKKNIFEFSDLVRNFPAATRELVNIIKQKEKSKIEEKDLKELELEMDYSSNRIAYSIVIAGLIISASLLIQTGLKPFIFGIPYISFIIFLIAIIIFIVLLASIAKEKKEVNR